MTRPAMRIAFYAPLKSPDHPVPSGDRRMAQLFFDALRLAGHDPQLASRFRSFEGHGDRERQARLAVLGDKLAQRCLRRWRAAPRTAPQLWFTYHIYHKAPDWLGPRVARGLGIPYVVAEASLAPKQEAGPWAAGHRAALKAIRQARTVIGLNPSDRGCVLPLLPDPARWVSFKPFLDTSLCPPRQRRTPNAPPRLVAAAMMRPGDKLASYRVLGATLLPLLDLDWSLEVVGDGAARPQVEAALAGLGDRVTWAGALDPDATLRRIADADLCVWPAVNEAFGMALLEAQACGVPVVAGASGGVPAIVAHGQTGLLAAPGDIAAFAAAVRRLVVDRGFAGRLGAAARRRVIAEHDLPVAAARLAAVIDWITPADAA
jgi:glycosyltransferase involved in cell wall biosynthesis